MFVHCLARIFVAQIPSGKRFFKVVLVKCWFQQSCQVSYGSCPQWDGEADAQLSVHLEAYCLHTVAAAPVVVLMRMYLKSVLRRTCRSPSSSVDAATRNCSSVSSAVPRSAACSSSV